MATGESMKWIARFILIGLLLFGFWFIMKINRKPILLNNDSIDSVGHSAYNWIFGGKLSRGGSQYHGHRGRRGPRYNKAEEMCRSILERMYGRPFPSVRPNFLKNPKTGKNLELDCYNPELRIALEYNGQQHHKYTPYFHSSKRQFYAQVHRDDWKRRKCREYGIKLIEVPYWIREDNLERYIMRSAAYRA